MKNFNVKLNLVNGEGKFVLPGVANMADRLSVKANPYDTQSVVSDITSCKPLIEVVEEDIVVTLTGNVTGSTVQAQVDVEIKFCDLPIPYFQIDTVNPQTLYLF